MYNLYLFELHHCMEMFTKNSETKYLTQLYVVQFNLN